MHPIGHGGPWGGIRAGGSAQSVVLETLSKFITPADIDSVLNQTGRRSERIRRLPAEVVVWLVIAMAIFNDLDIPSTWRQITGTLRSLWAVAEGCRPPVKSAFAQARQRLGSRPLRRLFVDRSAPIATDGTRGAFYRGMRLMAIDGVTFEIPDTPANARAFGRPTTKRNGERIDSGYPQIHAVLLTELGTHLVCEAFMKPYRCNEYKVGRSLLKKVSPGCLVLWDRGFYGYSSIKDALDLSVHVLGRVGSHVVFERLANLRDGSYLSRIYPSQKDKRHGTNPLVVRVIEYTIDDPHRTGHGELHRLVTTLLDPELDPALELAVLYHQRWEIEIGNDEIKTHQLHQGRPTTLRSLTPCGVVQEFYGLLLAYNAVRFLMHEAAVSVDIDPRQLSFIHAVRVTRETVPIMRAASAEQLSHIYEAMIRHIALGRLPPRDKRINPRVVKKKMSNYAKKRPEHYHVPQPKTPFKNSVVLLN